MAGIIKDPIPGAPVAPILPPQDGFLTLDKSKFPESFAADIPRDKAVFLADSQVPWGLRDDRRCNQQARVEEQTQLVPDFRRRPNDPARGSALDGQARGRDGR